MKRRPILPLSTTRAGPVRHNEAKLRRELNIFDATAIDIGAIIGAGIFVVIGVVASVAGAGLIISMLIAGSIAYLTAMSYAELSHRIPKEGGEYEFAYRVISHEAGYLDGLLWSASAIVSGAVVSVGFASYFVLMAPSLPLKGVAVLVIILMVIVNILGLKRSSLVNDALVVAKIAILLFFIFFGINQVNPQNFQNMYSFGWDGIIQGAGMIFFAFAGFGRVATIAEEVKEPTKTIPKAIMLALTVCTVIYFLTGFTAIGLLGSEALSRSTAPIAEAVSRAGSRYAVVLVAIGALAATSSVLLTEILGVSRIIYSMGRNRQMPAFFTKLHRQFGTPYVSIIVAGALMSLLALFMNFRQIIELSSFGLLGYYAITNLSAFMLKRDEQGLHRYLHKSRAFIGLIACLALMVYLASSLIAGI
ncbi:MAG: amino acid permease [Candidatus Micrarchaeota archaeon]